MDSASSLGELNARFQTLKAKLEGILYEIYQMRASEEFKVISTCDLEEFFRDKKSELEKKYEELTNKFGKNG